MAERPPGHVRQAWVEKAGAAPAPRSRPKPHEMSEVQLLRAGECAGAVEQGAPQPALPCPGPGSHPPARLASELPRRSGQEGSSVLAFLGQGLSLCPGASASLTRPQQGPLPVLPSSITPSLLGHTGDTGVPALSKGLWHPWELGRGLGFSLLLAPQPFLLSLGQICAALPWLCPGRKTIPWTSFEPSSGADQRYPWPLL